MEEDLKLQFACGRQNVADYVKMLNNLYFAQEGRRLSGEEWIFQHNTAAIYNASKTRKYLLKQKIRPQSNRENLGIDFCKNLIRRSTVLNNFWTRKRNLRCTEKIFGSTSETNCCLYIL